MLLAEKKEIFQQKSKAVIEIIVSQRDTEKAELLINDLFSTLLEDIYEIKEQKVEKSEIRELIIEMRHGFTMMDKRFEEMQKYLDVRFESVDKRFEAVDKRFESADKRFDDMNKRIAFMQWLMLFGFTLIGATMAVLKLFTS